MGVLVLIIVASVLGIGYLFIYGGSLGAATTTTTTVPNGPTPVPTPNAPTPQPTPKPTPVGPEPTPRPTPPKIDAKCSAHMGCTALQGNCCPSDEGICLGCCD